MYKGTPTPRGPSIRNCVGRPRARCLREASAGSLTPQRTDCGRVPTQGPSRSPPSFKGGSGARAQGSLDPGASLEARPEASSLPEEKRPRGPSGPPGSRRPRNGCAGVWLRSTRSLCQMMSSHPAALTRPESISRPALSRSIEFLAEVSLSIYVFD